MGSVAKLGSRNKGPLLILLALVAMWVGIAWGLRWALEWIGGR